MIRSFFRRGLRLGAVVGAIVLLIRTVLRRQAAPTPADTAPAAAPRPAAAPASSANHTDNGAVTTAPTPESVKAEAQPAARKSPAPGKASPKLETAKKKAAATSTLAGEAPTKTARTAKTAKATKAKKAAKAGKKAAPAEPTIPAWVEPTGGEAPATHPVKVKVSSGIYRTPDMTGYDRAAPDRCYRDAEAAEADGFRPPKN